MWSHPQMVKRRFMVNSQICGVKWSKKKSIQFHTSNIIFEPFFLLFSIIIKFLGLKKWHSETFHNLLIIIYLSFDVATLDSCRFLWLEFSELWFSSFFDISKASLKVWNWLKVSKNRNYFMKTSFLPKTKLLSGVLP